MTVVAVGASTAPAGVGALRKGVVVAGATVAAAAAVAVMVLSALGSCSAAVGSAEFVATTGVTATGAEVLAVAARIGAGFITAVGVVRAGAGAGAVTSVAAASFAGAALG